MNERNSKYCPFCDGERDKKQFVWHNVPIYKRDTTKSVEAVAICCAYCGRTISVIPSHLFFQD